MNIHAFKTEFDKKLLVFLHKKIGESQQLVTNTVVKQWLAYLSVLLLSGGKRLRPFALASMFEAADGTAEGSMWQGAIALELFHLFALVHDDIMDRSSLRHGVATTHAHIAEALKVHPDAPHIGESQAIILGDLLQNWAAQEMPLPAKSIYHTMASEVMVGQMLDIHLMNRFNTSPQEIIQKYLLKTARYTFVRPMQMGVALAGDSENLMTFCTEFGTALGIAFQIQDDLIDVSVSSHTSRKAVMRDMHCGQPTLLTAYVRDNGTPQQCAQLERHFGKTLKEADHFALSELFLKSGATEYAGERIDHYCLEAQKSVQRSPLSEKQKEQWQGLIAFVHSRQH